MKSPLLFSFMLPLVTLCFTTNPPPANHASSSNIITVTKDSKDDVVEFTDANFQSKALSSKKLTVVDLWAEWCGPCRKMGPIIEDLAIAYSGKANIGKLDVDNNPNVCAKYGIRSIPTILIIKDGKLIEKLVGLQSKSKLEKIIKQNI